MHLLYITLAFIFIMGAIMILNGSAKDRAFCGVCGAVMMVYAIVLSALVSDVPSALDVYRGKTVLKVTYIEAVPVDSVVVYKER